MSGLMSRNKGKAGEREVAELLRERGYEARRGQQFQGGPGSPDVVHSIAGIHIEVKRSETLNLYAALDQAEKDKKDNEAAVVFHRRNQKRWVVVMDANTFFELVEPRL